MPKLTDIEYHLQEENFYCGAACSQMVINQIVFQETGANPHTTKSCLDTKDAAGNKIRYVCSGTETNDCTKNTDTCQRCLYVESNCPDNSNFPGESWYSYPDALTKTLNHHRPPLFAQNFHFVLFESAASKLPNGTFSTDAAYIITHRIAWTIVNYKVAPIALVFSSMHWIVVTGYEAPTNPTSSTDASFDVSTISKFWIHNPFSLHWSKPLTPPPPPHSSADKCGSGIDQNGFDWGIAHEEILPADWFSNYLIPVSNSGHWYGKCLAICDPEEGIKQGKEIKMNQSMQEDKILDPDIITQIASRVLAETNATSYDFLPEQLKKAKPITPVLVKYLNRKNDFYYLVPAQGEDQKIYGYINIDGRYGNHKQSAYPNKQGFLRNIKMKTRKEVFKSLKKSANFWGKIILTVFQKMMTMSPYMVWMPCRESLSPNYPFQLAKIGWVKFYIRIDGAVFKKLDTTGQGM
jgi:GR25 family glycosyltransferase involved in LPS biosynthesis